MRVVWSQVESELHSAISGRCICSPSCICTCKWPRRRHLYALRCLIIARLGDLGRFIYRSSFFSLFLSLVASSGWSIRHIPHPSPHSALVCFTAYVILMLSTSAFPDLFSRCSLVVLFLRDTTGVLACLEMLSPHLPWAKSTFFVVSVFVRRKLIRHDALCSSLYAAIDHYRPTPVCRHPILVQIRDREHIVTILSLCTNKYRLVHKKIPYAVCWKVSKTLISKRRTLGEPFDFAQT